MAPLDTPLVWCTCLVTSDWHHWSPGAKKIQRSFCTFQFRILHPISHFYFRILHHLPENARILHYALCLPEKNIFPGIFGGMEGNPLAPVSYAYGWASGLPPPAKSGPGQHLRMAEM